MSSWNDTDNFITRNTKIWLLILVIIIGSFVFIRVNSLAKLNVLTPIFIIILAIFFILRLIGKFSTRDDSFSSSYGYERDYLDDYEDTTPRINNSTKTLGNISKGLWGIIKGTGNVAKYLGKKTVGLTWKVTKVGGKLGIELTEKAILIKELRKQIENVKKEIKISRRKIFKLIKDKKKLIEETEKENLNINTNTDFENRLRSKLFELEENLNNADKQLNIFKEKKFIEEEFVIAIDNMYKKSLDIKNDYGMLERRFKVLPGKISTAQINFLESIKKDVINKTNNFEKRFLSNKKGNDNENQEIDSNDVNLIRTYVIEMTQYFRAKISQLGKGNIIYDLCKKFMLKMKSMVDSNAINKVKKFKQDLNNVLNFLYKRIEKLISSKNDYIALKNLIDKDISEKIKSVEISFNNNIGKAKQKFSNETSAYFKQLLDELLGLQKMIPNKDSRLRSAISAMNEEIKRKHEAMTYMRSKRRKSTYSNFIDDMRKNQKNISDLIQNRIDVIGKLEDQRNNFLVNLDMEKYVLSSKENKEIETLLQLIKNFINDNKLNKVKIVKRPMNIYLAKIQGLMNQRPKLPKVSYIRSQVEIFKKDLDSKMKEQENKISKKSQQIDKLVKPIETQQKQNVA